MKMKQTLLSGVLLAGSLFAGALQAAETLTMSNWVPQTHFVFTDILKPWADEVEKVTEGRVKVRILPKALGAPPKHWELARKGVADITWGNFTYEPDRFKSIWFAEFPFAGRNATAQSVALWQAYEKHLQADKAYSGVKMLSVAMFGGGQMHHGSKNIVEPGDIAGEKFRMGGPIQQVLIESLGGVPVSAPATKAYEMLESKVIDGSLHTLESVVNFRLQDVLKHHTIIDQGLYDATFFLIMNEKKWNKLSEADQKAIDSISGAAFAKRWGGAFDQQNGDAEKALREAGHTFNEASPALIEKVTEIREQMIADWEAAAKENGIADPKALLADFEADYKKLAEE
ncbi:MAG: TRAP transporter substrate-binding protein [Thiolinea sp.]